MSGEQTGTTTTTGTEGQQTQANQQGSNAAAWTPPTKEDWERQQAEAKALRSEAAANRVKAKEAEQKANEEATKKAEAEGRIADVLKLERESKTQLESRLKELEAKAAEGETYKGAVASEVDALKKSLGDKVPPGIDALSPAQALPILRHTASLAAGPGAARQTTNGAPAVAQPKPELDKMTPAERSAYVATLSHDELRALAGATVNRSPFAMPIKR